MYNILSSEFFWGIAIGVVLSLLSAYAAMRFSINAGNREMQKRQRDFCHEIVENIQQYIYELDDHRLRARRIDDEYLALIDVEITIYGRNRENLILLDRNFRRTLQTFVRQVTVRRIEIANQLRAFDQAFQPANTLRRRKDARSISTAGRRAAPTESGSNGRRQASGSGESL